MLLLFHSLRCGFICIHAEFFGLIRLVIMIIFIGTSIAVITPVYVVIQSTLSLATLHLPRLLHHRDFPPPLPL